MGLSLVPWAVAGVLALGAGGWVLHCQKVKADYAQFIQKLEHQAEEQERRNKETADAQERAKQQADADTQRNLDSLHSTVKRLRDAARSSAVSLPRPAPTSSRPDLFCVDRAEYLREDGIITANLLAGARSLADEGSEATVALDVAKAWSLTLKLSMELK